MPSPDGTPSESSWTVFASFTTVGLLATLPTVLPPFGAWLAPTAHDWALLVMCGLLSVGAQIGEKVSWRSAVGSVITMIGVVWSVLSDRQSAGADA